MDAQNITQIKNLIATAPILSSEERGEWSLLLDLMNERQLQELQKILSSSVGGAQKPGPSVSEVAKSMGLKPHPPAARPPVSFNDAKKTSIAQMSPVQKPTTPPVQKPVIPPVQPVVKVGPAIPLPPRSNNPLPPLKGPLPSLSHIANLPSRVGSPANKPATPLVVQPVKPAAKPVTPEELAKNLQGSKSVGQLVSKSAVITPPAQPVKPVSIAPSQTSPFSLKLKQTVAEKELPAPVEAPKKVEAPVVQTPPPIKEPAPAPKPVAPPVAPPAAVEKPTPPVQPKPVVPPAKPLPKIEPLIRKAAAPSSFTPGLNFQRGSAKSAQDILKNIQEHSRAVEEKKEKAEVPLKIKLESLNDLGSLTVGALDQSDLDAAVKRIKELIGKFGYFDVIFSIEKSPLYKTYLATGLKTMTEQADLDQVAASGKPGEYLGRAQFEKFMDLLTRIQAA